MDLILGLLIAAIAFTGGIFSGRFIAPNTQRIKELEDAIAENNRQHQSYKDNVAKHFSETASLFGDMTEKYRSLYDHMSSGAYDLCDRRNIPRELASSYVNILAVESPEVSAQLNNQGEPIATLGKVSEEKVIDVSRQGLSPLDTKSQLIIKQNKKDNTGNENDDTAEIIDLDSQRSEDKSASPVEQAKDYAIKAKGVINHNSLNRDDVET